MKKSKEKNIKKIKKEEFANFCGSTRKIDEDIKRAFEEFFVRVFYDWKRKHAKDFVFDYDDVEKFASECAKNNIEIKINWKKILEIEGLRIKKHSNKRDGYTEVKRGAKALRELETITKDDMVEIFACENKYCGWHQPAIEQIFDANKQKCVRTLKAMVKQIKDEKLLLIKEFNQKTNKYRYQAISRSMQKELKKVFVLYANK